MSSNSEPNVKDLLDLSAPRKLHIGGEVRTPGWQILNVRPGDHVDIVGDLRKLDHLPDQSYDVIYSSHVIEHFGYQTELPLVLKTLRRLLAKGGKFILSVPDLEILCRLFVDPSLTGQERFHVMRMMFGGQMHGFDYHYVGLNWEFLKDYLHHAGFARAYRLSDLPLFNDTSRLRFHGVPISLNVVALVD